MARSSFSSSLGFDLSACNFSSEAFLPCYFETLFVFAVQLAIAFAVLMIMIGGFQWLMAVGNQSKIANAKTTISGAVIGLILALTSYLLLAQINRNLVEFQPLTAARVDLADLNGTSRPGAIRLCINGAGSLACEENPWCMWQAGACVYRYLAFQDAYETWTNVGASQKYNWFCCSYPGYRSPGHVFDDGDRVTDYNHEFLGIPTDLQQDLQLTPDEACQAVFNGPSISFWSDPGYHDWTASGHPDQSIACKDWVAYWQVETQPR